ncbi:MAG TPA: NAD(P)H-hydrate dehydratase [Candidatus Lustribacter sp.]|nr:NAD(P)H-hydrate dehydratase [Candidatus Lustribacter sp.]
MRAVTAAQMRAIDAAAVAREGEVELMRRAGAAIARVARRYRQDGPVIALAGSGNNGGDAFAALARLEGRRIAYYDPAASWGAARMFAFQRARASGVELRRYPVGADDLREAGLLLDGLLGVNARLPLDAATAERVRAMNDAGVPILALDVATGCDPTTGALGDAHVRATATVALGRPKLGSFLEPGCNATGDLWCAPIGMRDADAHGIDAAAFVLTNDGFDALRPRRAVEAEKRSAGAPLVIAGSEQFPGAAILCALGAARAGAGYVTVAAPAAAAAALRAHLIEQVVVTYDEADPAAAIATILDLCNHSNALAIGPGLGLSDAMGEIVRGVMAATQLPIVADASALFHLAKHLPEFAHKPLILTPHAGEFARLSGQGTVAPNERLARVRAFTAEFGITTLLKGRTTLIADRTSVHLNPTGTPALATAGTGDVLTGIIGTLLSQGLSPLDAGRVGAYWHGLAGQCAADARPVGVIAGDVADALGRAADVALDDDPIRLC